MNLSNSEEIFMIFECTVTTMKYMYNIWTDKCVLVLIVNVSVLMNRKTFNEFLLQYLATITVTTTVLFVFLNIMYCINPVPNYTNMQ